MAFIFTLCMNSIFYFFSDRIVLNMYRAEEIPPEELPWLHNIVEDLAQRMGIPKPRVYLIPHPSPNAFATGRSPSCAAVAVTQGLLKLLNPEEIKGVIGHELSHIKHRDTLIQTVAVSVAGAISMLAYWLRWRAIFGDDDAGSRGAGLNSGAEEGDLSWQVGHDGYHRRANLADGLSHGGIDFHRH